MWRLNLQHTDYTNVYANLHTNMYTSHLTYLERSNDMKEIKNVQGSTEQAQPLIVNKDTVYVHTNIVQATDEDGNIVDGLYVYDEVQYTKDEYIQIMAEKNSQLEQEVIDTQLALCELYESVGA